LAAIVALHLSAIVEAFAYWMENSYCDRSLTPGTVIMNRRAVQSEEGRVRVFRGSSFEHELKSHDLYVSGEQVTVRLELGGSDADAEVVFETNGGSFPAGGCDGRRSCRFSSVLQMPVLNDDGDDGTADDVVIWAGWASTHGVVQISEMFTLLPMTDENIQIAVMRAEGHLPAASLAPHRAEQHQQHQDEEEYMEDGGRMNEPGPNEASAVSLSGRLRGSAASARYIVGDDGLWSLLLVYGLLVAMAAFLIIFSLRNVTSRRTLRGKRK